MDGQSEVQPNSDRSTILHGVLLNVSGVGVLITGESGSGKSECALELLSRGHQLIADDVVEIENGNGRIYGQAPHRFLGLLEVRGLGLIDVRQIFGGNCFDRRSGIDICVEFFRDAEQKHFDPAKVGDFVSIFDVNVPRFKLESNRGRPLPLLIEMAAKLVLSPNANVGITVSEAHNHMVAS